MIAAHVQHDKMHMCRVPTAYAEAYPWPVGSEKIIAAKDEAIRAVSRWRDAVLAKTGWNGATWAAKVGISPTTITRNMNADWSGTAKLENLHALARAAGVRSVVDFLRDDPVATDALPPPEALAIVLDVIAAEMVGTRIPESSLRPAGRALALALQLLQENPAIHASPDAVRAVARTAVVRLPQTTPAE